VWYLLCHDHERGTVFVFSGPYEDEGLAREDERRFNEGASARAGDRTYSAAHESEVRRIFGDGSQAWEDRT
jgi:hypothetical protein